MAIAEKGQTSALTKHWDTEDLWLKEHIDDRKFILEPVRSEHMLADVLTKPMDAAQLRYFFPFYTRCVNPVPPKVARMAGAGKLDKDAKKKFQKWHRAYMKQQRAPQRVILTVGVFL